MIDRLILVYDDRVHIYHYKGQGFTGPQPSTPPYCTIVLQDQDLLVELRSYMQAHRRLHRKKAQEKEKRGRNYELLFFF